jgi:CRISPR-associated endonuclease/helicase Cas3
VGAQITRLLMRGSPPNMHDPALYTRYFQEYYRQVNLDEPQVQSARESLDYPETDSRFRMIEDDAASVIVRYGTDKEQEAIERAVAQLRAQRGSPRELLRQLQPYLVGLRQRELEQAQRAGLVEEVMPGLWEWRGRYDVEGGRGIELGGAMDPETTIW